MKHTATTPRTRAMPVVSVIIPAHNAESTLERTVASVLEQTHEQLEILIVDDGSTDGTAALADALAPRDSRIRVVHQPNGGVARARNRGLALATAPFVAPIDADDLWHPTKVEKQLAAMLDATADTAFVYSPCRVIDEHDRVLGSACAFRLSGRVVCRHVLVNFVGNGSALLLRRSAALAVGGYDPWLHDHGLQGSEDFQLQLRLAQRFRVEAVPEYLVGYRKLEGSMSSDIARMAQAELAVRTLFQREARDVPEPAFRWGAAARLADSALRSVRRGRTGQAARMLLHGARLDALGVAMQLGAQVLDRARHATGRALAPLYLRLGERAERLRRFRDYGPCEAMVLRPPWLVGRRLAQLAAHDVEQPAPAPEVQAACTVGPG